MKLLLTSGGLSNAAIVSALKSLCGKALTDAKVAFVPTAANAEGGNKNWLLDDIERLRQAGWAWFDVVDPSAADVDWRPRLEAADIIYISGGNTFHLLNQARQTGFFDWISQHANDKVYVGSSAGSILLTPTIATANGADVNNANLQNLDALNLVPFDFIPHVPSFIGMDQAIAYSKTTDREVYAVDDNTAIMVDDETTTVVGTGAWKLLKQGVEQ